MGKRGELEVVKQELFGNANMSGSGIYTSTCFSRNDGTGKPSSPLPGPASSQPPDRSRQNPCPAGPGNGGVTPADTALFLLIKIFLINHCRTETEQAESLGYFTRVYPASSLDLFRNKTQDGLRERISLELLTGWRLELGGGRMVQYTEN